MLILGIPLTLFCHLSQSTIVLATGDINRPRRTDESKFLVVHQNCCA